MSWLAAQLDLIWPLFWSLFWPSLAVICVFALAERRWPLEPAQSWRAWGFNLVWHALFLAVFLLLVNSAWGRFVDLLARQGAQPLVPRADSAAGSALRIALAVLAHDFFVYWGHRLMHAAPALWAFHRLHHDEKHLNASTSLRQHWLSIPVHQIVVFLPLAWLFGVEAQPAVLMWALIALGAFHHANLRLSLGPFTPWLVGPQAHRIHHAPPRALHDCNYASLFPVWDRLFGTWHAPRAHEFGATGLDTHPPTASQWQALAMPLPQWWSMLRGMTRTVPSKQSKSAT